jgi:outer membrane receptor protein involved in Fe transport
MDNQAPGLNFSVGSVIGTTELDVDNMELMSGASSALYGPGGMNGTLLINSKDPFKYQGLSFQIKQGVNHVDNYQRARAPFYDWSFRWAKKLSERWAFKIGAQFVQAQDWLGSNKSDYKIGADGTRTTGGVVSGGNRQNDPNYDGVNVYGDETTSSLTAVGTGVRTSIGATPQGAAGIAGIDGLIAANPSWTLTQLQTAIATTPALAGLQPLLNYTPILYASNASKNYFTGVNVSRTGYDEKDVVSPTTVNVKLTGALHYKINSNTTASLVANYGTGNTVYTGSDRYSLKNLRIGQYKFEIRSQNWFVRTYTTQEDAGDSYNATIAARLFNEAWSPSATVWYPTYASVYASAISQGLPTSAASIAARNAADQNRPTGYLPDNSIFQKILSTPISKGGALFLDRTNLYNTEAQYNLSHLLGLEKSGTDFLVGGNWKQYVLNSQGTLFADSAGRIKINELGAYAQLSQKLFNNVLKLSVSGRYDKNTNFDGRFTPRASAVIQVAKNQNIRLSYQQAYRFASTQNQWINLAINGGQYLIGGLSQMINYYQLNDPTTGVINPATGQPLSFGKFKAETSNSYEIGYKGLIGKRVMIDVYGYTGTFNDFIGAQTAYQVSTKRGFSVSVNLPGQVKTYGYGASIDYLMPKNFVFGANFYSDDITDAPANYVTYWNTPKYRANVTLSNTGFGKGNKWGFSAVYRWQDAFFYQATFGAGNINAIGTIDGMISYKLPKIKSLIKVGGTDIFNKYYVNGFGNAQIGGLYYVSFAYNVF